MEDDNLDSLTPQENITIPSTKRRKHAAVLFAVFSFLLINAVLIFKLYLNRKPVTSKAVVSQDQKNKVQQSFTNGYFFKAIENFTTGIKLAPQQNKESKTGIKAFYQLINNYSGSASIDKSNSVLGISEDNNPQNVSHFKMRIRGLINNPETNINEKYDLFVSYMSVLDNLNNRSLADIIINGQIGDLNLGDRDQDAVHLSIVRPEPTASYLNLSMSEFTLVALNRIIKGPSENSSIIYVDSDDVYPYLDEFVQIKETEYEELKLENKVEEYFKNFDDYKVQVYENNFKDFSQFLTEEKTYEDMVDGEKVIRIDYKINKQELLKAFVKYIQAVEQYAQDHQNIYIQLCPEADNLKENDCWLNYGYPSEQMSKQLTDLEKTSVLWDNLVKIERISFLLDGESQQYIGFDLTALVNNSTLEVTNKVIADQPHYTIAAPSNYYFFAGKTPKKSVAEQSPTDSLLNESVKNLFNVNRNFVLKVWDEDLSKLALQTSEYCQTLWKPEYCFQIGGDWSLDQEKIDMVAQKYYEGKYILFNYPPEFDLSLKAKRLSLGIINGGTLFEGKCEDDKYQDITTADGITLRIAYREDGTSISVDVCYLNPSGEATHISPYGKNITLFGQNMSVQEVIDKASEIITTFKFKGDQAVDKNKDYTLDDSNRSAYMEGAKNDPNACTVAGDQAEELRKDHQIETGYTVVMKEGTKFCSQSTPDHVACLICEKGKLSFREMDECKGLSCNP